MNKNRCFCVLFALFAVLLLYVQTAPTARAAQTTQTIRVGCVDIDNFLQRNGDTVTGYGADYLQEISLYTGWKYEYVYGTWSQCLQWLKDGTIDLLLPAEYSEERAQQFLFSQQKCCIDYVVLLTSTNNTSLYYEDFAHYNGITVGMIQDNYLNDCFTEYAKERGFTYQAVYYKTGEELTQALNQGQLDAIVTGNLDISADCKILAKFDYMSAYFMMNSTQSALMDQLNDALYQINLENPYFMAQLYTTYYGSYGQMAKVFTRQEAEYISSLGALRVVCDSDNAPFEWYDEHTQSYCGIDTDLLKQIAQNCGIPLSFIKTDSLKESWDLIQDGQADIIAGIYLDDALSREYALRATISYTVETSNAICRSDTAPSISDIHTVAIRSSFIGIIEYLKSHYPDWEIKTYPTQDDCLKAVEEGMVDLTFVGDYTLQTRPILEEHPKLEVFPGLTISVPMMLGVSEGASPLLVSILNKSARSISQMDIQQIITHNTIEQKQAFSLRMLIAQYPLTFALILFAILAIIFIYMLLYIRSRSNLRYANSMKETNQALHEANRATSTFFSQMSHDMRTPMNAVLGFAELGLESKDFNQAHTCLEKIRDSGQYLLKLINDSLQISRIDSDKLNFEYQPYSLQDLTRFLQMLLQQKADAKQLAFTIQYPQLENQVILADKQSLQQILVNLLNNAIKFTPSGGHIQLFMDKLPDNTQKSILRFRVSDDGCGMSPEFLRTGLYQPFEQEHGASSPEEQGTGLGLSIVKRLVQQLGGSITCQSKQHEGTCFTVLLPLELIDSGKAEAACAPTGCACLKGKHVLICEDHPLNTEIVTKLLQKQGALTHSASNGLEGIEAFVQSPTDYYAVILMDIRMPVMGGLEATKAIRQLDRPDAKTVPILAMTANAYPQDIQNCLDAGMNGHMAKPIETGKLYTALHTLLDTSCTNEIPPT